MNFVWVVPYLYNGRKRRGSFMHSKQMFLICLWTHIPGSSCKIPGTCESALGPSLKTLRWTKVPIIVSTVFINGILLPYVSSKVVAGQPWAMNCFITKSIEMKDISRFKKKCAIMEIKRSRPRKLNERRVRVTWVFAAPEIRIKMGHVRNELELSFYGVNNALRISWRICEACFFLESCLDRKRLIPW